MKIQVHGQHLTITEALEHYARQKFSPLSGLLEGNEDADLVLTLSVVHSTHRVEAVLRLHGVLLRAEASSKVMYASMDMTSDIMRQRIHRYKARVVERTRKGRHVEMDANFGTHADDDEEKRVVRVKNFPLKPMDIDEAQLQMDLLGHSFYVFTNASTEELNVLYRRKDGHYGLITPQ